MKKEVEFKVLLGREDIVPQAIMRLVSAVSSNTYTLIVDDKGIEYYECVLDDARINRARNRITDNRGNIFEIATVKHMERKGVTYNYQGSEINTLVIPQTLDGEVATILRAKVRTPNNGMLITVLY